MKTQRHTPEPSKETASHSNQWLIWGLVLPLIVYASRAVPRLLDASIPFDTEHTYLPLARRLIENAAALWSSPDSLATAPGTYVYMALLGADLTLIKAGNLAMALTTLVLLFDIGRRTAGYVAATGAAWLLALSPQHISYSIAPMVEPPSLFLLTLWLWATAWSIEHRRQSAQIVMGIGFAGLALAAATLTRATTMYWIPAIAIACLLAPLLPPLRRLEIPWHRLAAIHLLALALVGAYIVKNENVFQKTIIATGAGGALYFGNLLTTRGQEPPFYGLPHDNFVFSGQVSHLSIEGDKRMSDAVRTILSDVAPADLGRLYIEKSGDLLFFSKSHLRNYHHRVWRIILLVLAVAGCLLARKRAIVMLCAMLCLYMLAVHLPVLYNQRYSVLAFDIPLTILASIGIAQVWNSARRWRAISVTLLICMACVLLGAAHQRYSSPVFPDFESVPLKPVMLADPSKVSTTGFAADPFKQLASTTTNKISVIWLDAFPASEPLWLLRVQIKEMEGECSKAWMIYTDISGHTRSDYIPISSLRNEADFSHGFLQLHSPKPGTRLALEMQCSQNTKMQLGTIGVYWGSPGAYYLELQENAKQNGPH